MGPEVGSIVEGKITGITKFGAFVALPGGKSGLVHISEIANSYVGDIHDFVQMGQSVKVMVMALSPDGKINLSIKRAQDSGEGPGDNREQRSRSPRPAQRSESAGKNEKPSAPDNNQFEERLKKFMQESDSRIASNPMYSDHKKRNRRR